MVYHPCQEAGTHFEAAYGKRMTGEGTTYRERQKSQLQQGVWGGDGGGITGGAHDNTVW